MKTAEEITEAPRGIVGPRARMRARAVDVLQLLAAVGGEAIPDRTRRPVEAFVAKMA